MRREEAGGKPMDGEGGCEAGEGPKLEDGGTLGDPPWAAAAGECTKEAEAGTSG